MVQISYNEALITTLIKTSGAVVVVVMEIHLEKEGGSRGYDEIGRYPVELTVLGEWQEIFRR